MARGLKQIKGLLLFVMLFSVVARVFTGASEAQINFTSLIIDQNSYQTLDRQALLHDVQLANSSSASSIPDKHRTYSTYKKYLSPEKSLAVKSDASTLQTVSSKFSHTHYQSHRERSVYRVLSNSPPTLS